MSGSMPVSQQLPGTLEKIEEGGRKEKKYNQKVEKNLAKAKAEVLKKTPIDIEFSKDNL